MPSNRQSLILDAISAAITDAGFQPYIEREWANTGVIGALTEDFDFRGELRYNFQSGSCRFTRSGDPTPRVCHYYGKARTPGSIPAVKSSIPEVVEAVTNELLDQ